ncbi:MAG: allophanate hydrolase-related protein [Candidatus Dormibacterales bacterium]
MEADSASGGGREPASSLLFVNGTLMRGLPLNGNLTGATFVARLRTAPHYRLHTVGDVHPGMYRVAEGGVAIEGELYDVPGRVWKKVRSGEPPHLYRGSVELEDGRWVDGILYPKGLAQSHPDISSHGGWRAYREAALREPGAPLTRDGGR